LIKVKEAMPSTPVVVISGNGQASHIWRAIELGAAGYIPKDTDPTIVANALRLVLARGVYIPPQALQADFSAASHDHTDVTSTKSILSARQLAVLKSLLQGKSNKAIARDLNIAEGTAKAHLWSIYQLLGVNSRLQAMAKAHQLGLVESFDLLEK
jgi:DNA-binding NarL/FixJ family response regulator